MFPVSRSRFPVRTDLPELKNVKATVAPRARGAFVAAASL